MYVKFLILFAFILVSCSNSSKNEVLNIEHNLEIAKSQYSNMIISIRDSARNPRSVDEDNETILVPSMDWTSGFFPGGLWYIYEFTNDEKWRSYAEKFTGLLEKEKFNAGTHDMGFKIYCSFGNGFRLTKDENYKDILLQSAKTLATRFNSKVGCIRSWDFNKEVWQYPVIIDNMMNLELLFWASNETGDSSFHDIAVQHAITTMKNHFRDDNSTWHVVNYDTSSGTVINKQTHQGYSDESTWARGQAWGLYGYTMCYRETKDPVFLEKAQEIANFMLEHDNLPPNGIPYWDFNAPNIPNEERDASAASITASALYELCGFMNDKKKFNYYKEYADLILTSLSSNNYLAHEENNNFILKHSVGNKPAHSEIDVPLIYADYYFIEANLRRLNLSNEHIKN